MISIFSSNSVPVLNFLKRFLPSTIAVIALYIILPVSDMESFSNRGIQIIIVLSFLMIIFQLYVSFIYCKEYISSIYLDNDLLTLSVKQLFTNSIKTHSYDIRDANINLNVSESLLSLNTIGISTYKFVFLYRGKLIYTQYQIGDWSRKEMLRVKEEIEGLSR